MRLFRDMAMEEVKNADSPGPYLFAGSSIVVRDLTEWPANNWARYYPTGGFGTRDEEFLAVADNLISREAAWTTAQGFEAFETCLKDLLAAFYHAHPDTADPTALRKHESSLQQKAPAQSEPDFWSTFVREKYRSADDVLRVLRRIAPQFVEAEHKNNRARDLTKWFAVVTKLRHVTTHSNLTIRKAEWGALSVDEQKLTKELFSGVQRGGAYELRPTVKQANDTLSRFAEYGYAAFKALCLAGGHDWRIFK
jgi:hypothetical protein